MIKFVGIELKRKKIHILNSTVQKRSERDMSALKNRNRRYFLWKRLLDVLFSFLLLFFLALPMIAIACAVRFTSRGGAIFKQTRVGRNGEPFVCYKFRTMYSYAPKNRPTSEFTDAALYITPVGRFLRRTSLDELPQLFNVLKGDMSLIGPRPLIAEEEAVHRLRMERGIYDIRPGITGLAQISGRDLVSDREKAELDAKYVEGIGFATDFGILFKTLRRVVGGDGIR